MTRKLRVARPLLDFVEFKGGYDTESRSWNVKPGRLRESQNYEIAINNQGYVDIEGYERFDGRPSPSDAVYSIFDVNITGSFSVGDTITQLVTGATARVLAVVTTETPDYLVISRVTGSFNDSDDLQVSAVTEGTPLNIPVQSAGSTPLLNAQYLLLTANDTRTDISAVPGSGPVRGIHILDDIWYAFRDNAGATASVLFKSSATGWTVVPLGFELVFDSGGTYEVLDGDVITGATSGSTATVTRVVMESGSWSGGDAVGRFIFASQSAAFVAEDLNVGANLDVATIAGDSTAIALLAGGRYEMVSENFGGPAGTRRIYGCDKKNRGFEFDGTVFVPINAEMPVDTPAHVIVHKNHLFFAFGGSAQHSGIGTPYIFSPIFGAAELATGDTITAFMAEPGSETSATLSIFNRNKVHMLYGTSAADWNLVTFRNELGAFEYTVQQFGQTMYLDDRGVTTMRTVLDYGNFQQATVSRHIQTFINLKKTLAVASCIARDKNQYRIFFSDNSGLYITTEGRRVVGLMPIAFRDAVNVIASLEDNSGNEILMFGGDNGFVCQLDRGTSFDGGNIEAFFRTHYDFSGDIRIIKRYLGVTIEAEGTGYAEFNLTTEIGYNSLDISQQTTQLQSLGFRATIWDEFTWDQFTWDGVTLAPVNLKLEGSGENISLVIRKDSAYFSPISLTGAILRYTNRRQLR